jgi:hypothetical protein
MIEKNLPQDKIHLFIASDFKGVWNSVATNPNDISRGNFMFSRQAMNLLEFVFWLCKNDLNQNALKDFSNELHKIEPKYFTQLPSQCTSNKDFALFYMGNTNGSLLLCALFDLIRNGLAHQYQQILVNLSDGKNLFITLTGPESGRTLEVAAKPPRPMDHLGYCVDSDGDLGLKIYPDVLFLDLEGAIQRSGLLDRNLAFQYLERTHKKKPGYYNFDTASLENSLVTQGHSKNYVLDSI